MLNFNSITLWILVIAVIVSLLIDPSNAGPGEKINRNKDKTKISNEKPFYKEVYDYIKKFFSDEKSEPPAVASVVESLPFRWQHQMLYLINQARTAQPLKLSHRLQKDAQLAAEKCEEVVFEDSRLFAYSASRYFSYKADVDGVTVVEEWKALESKYDPLNEMCLSGKECTAYKNMVKRDMRYVGCGKSKCEDGIREGKEQKESYRKGVNVVCFFTPYGIA